MDDPYASCAKFYNLLAEPWLRAVKRRIVKDCLDMNCSPVLDMGCGTGTLVRLLRQAGIRAAGLDLSPGMLAEAGRVFRGAPDLALGRGEQLPFAGGAFRGVILTLMIHENPPARGKAILEEAFRVLAPGGTLFILEYQRISTLAGRVARWVEYALERSAGQDHFRNYRTFLRQGAVQSLLASVPRERIRWRPFIFHSMALAEVEAKTPSP